MGIQRVPNQLKRAPTMALRAVFAGIGRILLSADRPIASAGQAAIRAASNGEQPRELTAGRRRPGPAPVAPPGSRWRSLDQTGNVRLLSDENIDDEYDVPPERGRSGVGTGRVAALAGDGASRATRSRASRRTLPLANYDDLSLPSIRARLRGLDVSQLRVLAKYESKNAKRPEVLGMFERRIEKLESGD
jgi:hypothetical protein